jgi:hypothetical protein
MCSESQTRPASRAHSTNSTQARAQRPCEACEVREISRWESGGGRAEPERFSVSGTSLDPLKHPNISGPAEPALGEGLTPEPDPIESDPLAIQSRWQRRIHKGRWGTRRATVDAFRFSGVERLEKRASRIASCGACPMMSVSEHGEPRLHPGLCRDRLCPTCGRMRAHTLSKQTRALINDADAVRLVTLTMQQTDEPLANQLANLRDAWKRLRRMLWWKDRVRGGVYGVEVKWSTTNGRWHPHLHALVVGEYLEQRVLSAIWSELTGGSFIVDVRMVNNRADGAAYVAAYVAKGSRVDQWPPDRIAEFGEAMHGVRLLQTFGCMHGRKLDADDDGEGDFTRSTAVDLVPLRAAAKAGDWHAMRACVLVERIEPSIGEVLCEGLDLSWMRQCVHDEDPAAALFAWVGWHRWLYPAPPPPEDTGEPMPRQDEQNRAALHRMNRNRQQAFADAAGRWDAKLPGER